MSPSEHWASVVHAPAPDWSRSPDPTVVSTKTLMAGHGPSFVTVAVYVTVWPWAALVGPSSAATRSAYLLTFVSAGGAGVTVALVPATPTVSCPRNALAASSGQSAKSAGMASL